MCTPFDAVPSSGSAWVPQSSIITEMVAFLVDTVITERLHGREALASAAIAALLQYRGHDDWRAAVERVLSENVHAAVGRAWQMGWQPADLLRRTRRTLGERHVDLLGDAIVAELQGYATITIDPRWLAQLTESGATVWWPSDQTYLGARSQRVGQDWGQMLAEAIDVLCLLVTLSPLEQLSPLPGTARPPTGGPASDGRQTAGPAVDARALERVRALLAKAESTNHTAEAEALIAAAQERMARHNIDLAMLAATGPGPTTEPSGRRIGIDAPYKGPKAALLQEIAAVNRCRSVWSPRRGFCTVIGFDPDLDTVETLFTSILVQAATAMTRVDSGNRSGTHTRAFRAAFLYAYAIRVGERLREVVQTQTTAAAGAPGGRDLLPVLASRNAAVDRALQQMFPEVTAKSVEPITDADGWHSGKGAADLATLHASPLITRQEPRDGS